ncbi:MAG TPA: porin family protein [candidate division Zixibacteria bacterium]|nr:porin family protein [candidate division Zixibacteria bacterium]
MKAISLKRFFTALSVMLILSAFAVADDQESKHQISVQGSTFIGKDTTGNGIRNTMTNTGGLVVSYRYNLNQRFAFEGDFDYFRNSLKYSTTSGVSAVNNNVFGSTGALVIKLPKTTTFKPYTLVGAGALSFSPRDKSPYDNQTRAAFVYGGGIDIPVMKHVAFRTEYRGFVYKVPDFGNNNFKVNGFTHSAVPSVGFVYNF